MQASKKACGKLLKDPATLSTEYRPKTLALNLAVVQRFIVLPNPSQGEKGCFQPFNLFQTMNMKSMEKYLGMVSALEENFMDFKRLKEELCKVI